MYMMDACSKKQVFLDSHLRIIIKFIHDMYYTCISGVKDILILFPIVKWIWSLNMEKAMSDIKKYDGG